MKSLRVTLLLSLYCLSVSLPATAGELGNIFNPEVEEQSRQASAQALEGIGEIFAALRQRELRNISEGSGLLSTAAASLYKAADMMHSVSIPAGADKSISWQVVSDGDRRIVAAMARRLKRDIPGMLSELYGAFAESTKRLGGLVEQQTKADAEPILPNLSEEVALYIRFGDAVAKIARSLT